MEMLINGARRREAAGGREMQMSDRWVEERSARRPWL